MGESNKSRCCCHRHQHHRRRHRSICTIDFIYLAFGNFSNFMTNINIFCVYLWLLIYKNRIRLHVFFYRFWLDIMRACACDWHQIKLNGWMNHQKVLNSCYMCVCVYVWNRVYWEIRDIYKYTHTHRRMCIFLRNAKTNERTKKKKWIGTRWRNRSEKFCVVHGSFLRIACVYIIGLNRR